MSDADKPDVEDLARQIAATTLDGIHSEPLEYVLRRGYAAMGMDPALSKAMCRKLAECQIEESS